MAATVIEYWVVRIGLSVLLFGGLCFFSFGCGQQISGDVLVVVNTGQVTITHFLNL